MKETPRERLTKRFLALGNDKATNYARFIEKGDRGKPLPCWGMIVRRFNEVFKHDKDWLQAMGILVEDGNKPALILFMERARKRPVILKALLERSGQLPVSIQRMLVSLNEVEGFVQDYRSGLHPSAVELLQSGNDAIARDRGQFENKVAELLTYEYFIPEKQKKSGKSARKKRAI